MDMSIEKMLSHVYEIEGLMLVTRRLGEENTPDVITNKLKRKVRELADMCGVELKAAEPEAQPFEAQPAEKAQPEPVADVQEPVQASVQEPVQETVQEEAEHLPEEDYDADETWQHDNGEEFKEVFTLDYQEPQHEEENLEQVPVEDREPDDDITVEFIEAEDEPGEAVEDEESDAETPAAETPADEQPATPVEPVVMPPVFHMPDDSDEPTPAPDPKVIPEAEDEPDITVEFIDAEDEALPEPEDEMPIPPVPTDFPVVEETNAPLRVDEKLQRTMSKDIRKAISLNDRFRFQRELFANSANALDTAIEHIEAMRTYGNAELYFFTQLGWDRDNEVVQDFMNIVRNHFQQRN